MPSRNDKPASKADLAAVETGLKADIAAVETGLKADIAAVKTELKADIHGLAVELVKTQGSLRTLEETMATKSDIGRIMNAIDGFAGKLETYARESVTLPHIIDEQGKTLETHGATLGEHDRRLKAVESSR